MSSWWLTGKRPESVSFLLLHHKVTHYNDTVHIPPKNWFDIQSDLPLYNKFIIAFPFSIHDGQLSQFVIVHDGNHMPFIVEKSMEEGLPDSTRL